MPRLLLVLVAALAVTPAAHARTDEPWQLSLAWPANGTLTSPYGWDDGRRHSGLDIGVLRSLDVRAAARGEVVRVGTPRGYEGYGIVVEIRVSDSLSTLYAHLAGPLVRVGDHVAAGDAVGIAGCTGWCTGTHLHFELRDRGKPVDPSPFVAR